ncbi:MAG: hypothetical protein K0Q72_2903 [Armatimonadetes bacterium]|jgi:hypothetical protein|nr:hypothetical protein [Armatimonadota bacterium]
MNGQEAEQTLEVIRTLMERGTRYTNLSGHAGIAAGICALAGCALREWAHTPFLPTWMGVLLAACTACAFFTARMAASNGEPLWTRQARTAVAALLPSLVAALVLTAVLASNGQEAILPGVWMLLWGVGALAISFFTPRVMSALGLTFMGAGTVALLTPPARDVITMGVTFGVLHLIYGIALTITPRSEFAGPAVPTDA